MAETVAGAASMSFVHQRPGPSRAGPSGVIPRLGLRLAPLSRVPYWPLIALFAVAGLLLILLRAPRQFLPSPVRGLVEVHQLDIWLFAAAIWLALLTGFLAVALTQAPVL